MTARLTLICHGSTSAVRAAAFPADEPLDDRGRASTMALAGRLPRTKRCWTSPELRTRQTAELLGLDAVVQPELRDCDYGSWTGRSLQEVMARELEAGSRWICDPTARPHGGESLSSLMERVAAWLDARHDLSGQAVVVTHASVIRAAIVRALEAPPQSFWRIDITPLSFTRLSGAGGRWNLASIEPARSR